MADLSGPGYKPIFTSFQSPVKEILAQVPTAQHNFQCRDIELNVMDCADAYGKKGLLNECKDVYDDYKECLFSRKQLARVQMMQKERMRQYMAGERTKKDLYANTPLLDGYNRTYKKTIGG